MVGGMEMNKEKGFTLIELTTAIVITAVLGVVAGMGLLQIANGYSFAKKNTAAAQQAQVALTRIVKELTDLSSIDESASQTGSTKIRYTRDGINWHVLAWNTDSKILTLDGDKLLEKVQSFSLTYRNTYSGTATAYSSSTSVIEVAFELRVYNDTPVIFVQRVGI